jgi:hypothetical protein
MANRDFGALVQQWQDLEAADIPLEPIENRVGIDIRNRGAGLTIRAGRDRWNSEIRELKNGCFAYILPVFIRRDFSGKSIIRDSWIEAPWPSAPIDFLEDPKDEGRHPRYYKFPGDTEHFMREKVLNHRMACVLSRGDIREGLLLGVGLRPPETYKNHCKIEVRFCVLDQWDVVHDAKLQMQINRLPTRDKEIKKSKRGPLHSRPDPKPAATEYQGPLSPLTKGPVDRFDPDDPEQVRRLNEDLAKLGEDLDRLCKEALAKEENKSETPKEIAPELERSVRSRRGAGARKGKTPA